MSSRGHAASVYVDLLAAAEAAGSQTGGPSVPEVVAELRRRGALAGSEALGDEQSPSDALSAQIAYDVALLRCAKLLGVDASASDFDPPARGRARLEAAVADAIEGAAGTE